MNIKGQIKWVSPVTSFQTQDKRIFQKKEAVIETMEQYPQSLCFEIIGENVNHQFLEQGYVVEVYYNMKAQEYQGRYYNKARAWKIVLIQDK